MQQTWIQHYSLDQVANIYEKVSNRLISNWRRSKLNNVDFSILSNNCWGGHVYRRFGLPYSSPTVGMYFYTDEYIRFLQDIEANIYGSLEFIEYSESKYCVDLKRKGQTNIPIGLLNGKIEVVFLHYHSESEAYEKWRRRSERLNMDNLIVKISQMNRCSSNSIKTFHNMGFRKKVLLLAKPMDGVNGIVVNRYTDGDEVKDDTTYYANHIDLIELINS